MFLYIIHADKSCPENVNAEPKKATETSYKNSYLV